MTALGTIQGLISSKSPFKIGGGIPPFIFLLKSVYYHKHAFDSDGGSKTLDSTLEEDKNW